MRDSHKKARLWGQAGQYREGGASTRCLESRRGVGDSKEADTRSLAMAGPCLFLLGLRGHRLKFWA